MGYKLLRVGRLLQISIRQEAHGYALLPDAVCISKSSGITGNFRGKRKQGEGRRQVTILSKEQWVAACKDIGATLPWTVRRANFLVDGITFSMEDAGRKLILGGSEVVLTITGETTPCQRMDEVWQGLTKALTPDWRGGVTCRVDIGGSIAVGDCVQLMSAR
jgi:MOSC domain-containing protein YiiM